MAIQLSQRVSTLNESATLALAAKAKELKSQGLDILSLTVGEPDWPTVSPAVDEAIKAIKEGQTKYTPASGNVSLRKIIVERFNQDFKTNYSEANVSVASGAKFSLFAAFQALLDPNDEVIMPNPFWVSYPDMIQLCGAKAIAIDLQGIGESPDKQKAFEKAFNLKTKMLLLNTPNNPSGLSLSTNDLKFIASVMKKNTQVAIICDDIYNRLVFDGSKRAPHLLDVAPELIDSLISINGASKSFSMTGWRIGWAIGPKPIIQAIASYQSQSTGCPNSIAQAAVEAALKEADADVEGAKKLLRERRDIFIEALKVIDHLKYDVPTGAFYLWLDVSYYLDKKGWTCDQFCQALLEKEALVVVPGTAFGQDKYIRLSFAVDEKTIQKSVTRLHNFIQSV